MGKGDIMRDSYNQKFDYLIKELTNELCGFYVKTIASHKEFQKITDTSPLLNMTLSVFMSSLINMLDLIKSKTIGEVKLMDNIELTKQALTKAISDLPFIKGVEEMK